MSDLPRYMIATRAFHKLGDISRDEPDLAFIDEETETDYVGHWVSGFGFRKVRFPKTGTRELTDDEKRHYRGMTVELAGVDLGPIRIEDPSDR